MSKLFVKRSGIIFVGLFLISMTSFSQIKDVDFLRSVPSDGVKYLQAYLTPWANAFGSGLSGGWYNTAKPHKFGGFDITAGISVGIVPSSVETFDVTKIGLSSAVSGTGKTIVSTVAGPKTSNTQMNYKVNGVTLASFNAPKGTDWRYIPVPTAQIGIGLPLGTEVKVRFIPKTKIQKGDISLWGIGLMHSLTQYLPGSKLSPFDVSLFGGFTKLKGDVALALAPDPEVIQEYTSPYSAATSFNDQNLKVTVQGLNVGVIGSLNLKVLTFYGGLGYCKTQTSMELSGNFPTPVLATAPEPVHVSYNNAGVKKGSDFPEIDIKNYSGVRANIGFRLKFSVITFHVDYTKAQYNVLSTGLGISFR